MEFLLNRDLKPKTVDCINPNTTVLQWLRANDLVGSKEGCASGDCGACVAVVVSLDNGELRYQSVNTCLALMLTIAGKMLITVEGLEQKGKLHSVQQAMLDHHGSQCGFCTPGFVMSLFALSKNFGKGGKTRLITQETVNEALSGNLCRCTGYVPIIKAAFEICEKPSDDFYTQNEQKIIKSLRKLNINAGPKPANKSPPGKQVQYSKNQQAFNYFAPTSTRQLAEILAKNQDAQIIAGGTDLSLTITQNNLQHHCLVNIANVKDLNTIKESEKSIKIGGTVTLTQAHEILTKNFPALESYLNRFASLPIRNVATIAGNIANASPIGDMPPVLLALQSDLLVTKLTSNKLSSRKIELNDFYLDYKKTGLEKSEFIQQINIPKLSQKQRLFVFKISKRYEDDISAVSLAIKITINSKQAEPTPDEIVIAFGGMAAIPKRAKSLEKLLMKQWHSNKLTNLVLEDLTKEFIPLSDVRAGSQYRLQIAAKLIEKFRLHFDTTHSNKLTNLAVYVETQPKSANNTGLNTSGVLD